MFDGLPFLASFAGPDKRLFESSKPIARVMILIGCLVEGVRCWEARARPSKD